MFATAIKVAVGFLVVSLAGGLAQAIREWRREDRRRKLDASERELDGDAGCAACGRAEVAWIAEGVYVCGACGYEGGEGMAALEVWRRRQRLLDRPETERSRLAERKRADAETSLRAAVQILDELVADLTGEAMGADPRVAHAWEGQVLEGLQLVREGLAALDDARVLEGGAFSSDTRLDRIDPRMWYSGELGAEVDLVVLRADLAAARSVARDALGHLIDRR